MRLALLLALLAGCGAVGLDASDAGKPDLDLGGSTDAGHDAVLEAPHCQPTTLTCTGGAGACPQGQAMAVRSVCGGPAVAVCCPVNDCELALCDVCPLCVP